MGGISDVQGRCQPLARTLPIILQHLWHIYSIMICTSSPLFWQLLHQYSGQWNQKNTLKNQWFWLRILQKSWFFINDMHNRRSTTRGAERAKDLYSMGWIKGKTWPLEIRPLWDWNRLHWYFQDYGLYLKSDHYGIEMNAPHSIIIYVWDLEIRPLWDWNLWSKKDTPQSVDLKSDHYGIEIREYICKCTYKSSWNQTTMGLKLMSPCLRFSMYILEIRPLWDWNVVIVISLGSEDFSWNQTTMGLKSIFHQIIF